jgi:hypothetical protein
MKKSSRGRAILRKFSLSRTISTLIVNTSRHPGEPTLSSGLI